MKPFVEDQYIRFKSECQSFLAGLASSGLGLCHLEQHHQSRSPTPGPGRAESQAAHGFSDPQTSPKSQTRLSLWEEPASGTGRLGASLTSRPGTSLHAWASFRGDVETKTATRAAPPNVPFLGHVICSERHLHQRNLMHTRTSKTCPGDTIPPDLLPHTINALRPPLDWSSSLTDHTRA
ncbi:hypothetical protein RRG08_010193 [Elysia crispata]|uniref:Uncharacterized protein n=1 Tax=Elysia crispata TaxID=231223 RepID=A0AAE1AJ86_9GAST|nr:hypothetical protein RRG08_010193 [Elysia crispata]